jgi:hypothetical protein
MGISPSYRCDTTRRSCFAKRFFKTDSASPANSLHQHSHSHSRAKRTLSIESFVTLIIDDKTELFFMITTMIFCLD